MREHLLQRLRDREDSLTERKPEGVNSSEVRRTLVAFANSVSEGQKGVLFIGISDDGKLTGVTNPDSLQKKIRDAAEKECYPPVSYRSHVLDVEGISVLAVVVEASAERPHFAGPAYVRKGSESVTASKQVYDDLIASRNSKAGAMLREKGKTITFVQVDIDRFGRETIRFAVECTIEGCDAHVLDLKDNGADRYFSIPLSKTRINRDQKQRRMMIEAIG